MAPITRSMAKKQEGRRRGESRRQKGGNRRKRREKSRSTSQKAVTVARTPAPSTRRVTAKSPKPAFRLLDLPQEIADMIYRHMIHAGQVQILTTCSAVRNAASALMHSEGVYRVPPREFPIIPYDYKFRIPNQLAATVQHISFRTDVEPFAHYMTSLDFGYFSFLNRDQVPRQTCTISVRCLRNRHSPWNPVGLLHVLEHSKSDFETVIICAHPWLGIWQATANPKMPSYIKSGLKQHFVPILGPGTLEEDSERGKYAEFHPRAHKARLAAQSKLVVRNKGGWG